VKKSVAGRDTLSAIADELARDLPLKHRPKLDTLNYADRPVPGTRPTQGSSPEVITIGEGTMGRATLAAIDESLAAEARAMMAATPETAVRAGIASRPVLAPAQIFEVSTFIVEGDEIFSKASEQSRRDFVEKRLLHRLPALSMAEVVRIDLSRGAAPNTVILRVWSKVGDPPA
jgi:hypothetical protein